VPEISQNDEMALLSKADVVMVDQEDEATTVRRCLAVGRVITAPMAVVPAAMPQVGRGRSVLFVGGDTATDTTGLSWFLEDVWPEVRAGVPDAIFWIAGPVCRTVRRVPDGVELRATVRDLTTLYKEAAVVVSPQPEGSGLNINLAEAFGHGKAVVATGVMLRGMMLEACGAVASGATASADKPADFAAAVVALLLDEGQRMAYAKACLEMAHARLSPAACHAEFLALVSAANPGKSPVFS
jgi:succinoglycan biosynthesis protein ExoO